VKVTAFDSLMASASCGDRTPQVEIAYIRAVGHRRRVLGAGGDVAFSGSAPLALPIWGAVSANHPAAAARVWCQTKRSSRPDERERGSAYHGKAAI
jgi:hypothetical protein